MSLDSAVGQPGTYLPQADNRQILASDLFSLEGGFTLLNHFTYLAWFQIGKRLTKANTPINIALPDAYHRKYQIYHGIGIGTRSIEYTNTSAGSLRNVDVIYPRTSPRHGIERRIQADINLFI